MNKYYSLSIALCFFLIGSIQSNLFAQLNDNVVNAIVLPVDGSLNNYSSFGSTVQAGEAALSPPVANNGPNAGSGFYGWFEPTVTNTIWFTFIAPASGAVSIDLCGMGMNGSTFDSQVAVFDVGDSSDFSTFVLRGANDDVVDCYPQDFGGPLPNTDPSIWASYLEVSCLTAGKKYWLMIDGYNGDTGNAGIVLSEIVVVIDPLVLETSGANPASCPGVGGGGGSLLVSVTGGGFPYDISWSNGATNSLELSDLDAGTYTMNLSDACDSTITASVVVPELADVFPALTAEAGGDVTGEMTKCFSDSVTLGGAPAGIGGKPNLGSNAYYISYDLSNGGTSGDVLVNSTIEAPDQGIDLGLDTAYSINLFSMDFGPDGILFALNGADNQIVAINESAMPAAFFGLGSITPVPDHNFISIMYDESSDIMYAMSYNDVTTGTQLYTIDVQTATATPTVPIALPLGFNAAFDTAGILYVINLNDAGLYTVDPATGVATLVGNTGVSFRFIDANDMDFDPTTNRLYLSASTDDGNILREVNTSTGVATIVNSVSSTTTTRFTGGFALAPTDEATRYDYGWSPALALTPANGDVANPVSNVPLDFDYTLTITDACGTTASDMISIIVNDDPSVSVSSTPDNGTGNGTVSAMGMGGSGTYSFTWTDAMGDTISMDATATDLESGMYTVMMEDENGCSISDMITIGSNVSIDQLLDAGITSISAYPNPSHGIVTIKIELINVDDMRVSISDLRGKSVWESAEHTTSLFEERVNLSDLPGGMYLIQVETSKGNSVQRLTLN